MTMGRSDQSRAGSVDDNTAYLLHREQPSQRHQQPTPPPPEVTQISESERINLWFDERFEEQLQMSPGNVDQAGAQRAIRRVRRRQ